jgi:hypothetical protein
MYNTYTSNYFLRAPCLRTFLALAKVEKYIYEYQS